MSNARRIIVVDANGPWVRSLFVAMTGRAEVHAYRVYNAVTSNRPPLRRLLSWEKQPNGLWEKHLLIPGWTRFPRISKMLVLRSIRRLIRRLGGVDLIVYTLPFYADVAQALRGSVMQVYQASDPFIFYDWDPTRTAQLESRMLEICEASFTVAKALGKDFRKISAKPVFDCPNAVSTSFVEALRNRSQAVAVPEDLRAMPRPIIGCIGQINRSYDWPLIDALAAGLPQFTFVFVGPIFNETPEVRRQIDNVFARPNVKSLGSRPHDQLPAYLGAFDVCFNPLTINDQNDRRSPLRLYDYLATNKPIVSTAIREALTHAPLVETFRTVDEGIQLLRRTVSEAYRVDFPARDAYIRGNTWEARASQFLSNIDQIVPAAR